VTSKATTAANKGADVTGKTVDYVNKEYEDEELDWIMKLTVGPGRYCSPRHPTHSEPSFIELKGIQ
jgi:hypothetical protein